jgi:phosphoserine phosphatase
VAIKLFFLDLEGTLFNKQHIDRPHGHNHSLWARIFHELGPEALAADNVHIEEFERGEINYIQWCERSLRAMQTHGLTKQLLEHIMQQIQYNNGVAETIAALHAKGIRTAIISGGFMEQAKRAQLDLRIQHAFAAVEIYWNADGSMAFWNIFPSDYQAKADYVELLRRECGFSKEECAFIGDGKNDVPIASHVGLSFAYNAHPALQEKTTHSITDFQDILKYLS